MSSTTPSTDAFPRLDRLTPRGRFVGSRRGRWRAAVLIGVHALIAAHILHWQLSGETVTPMEPSEAMETLERGVINAGLLMFAVAIVLTVFVGRYFCGWACHLVAYQDGAGWLLNKLGLKPRPLHSRVLWLAPFAVAFWMFVKPTLVRVLWTDEPTPELRWGLVDSGFWDTFPGPWMGLATFLVLGFLMIWWLGAKAFCFYGCPYGAFFGVVDRISPTRIVVSDACRTCAHCTTVCTSNVRVHEEVAKFGMVVDSGCMKTMDCVSACPNDALSVRLTTPSAFRSSHPSRQGSSHKPRKRKPPSDFSWFEEGLLVACGLGALLALRGLYVPWFDELIPFLLSVGVAVLTGVGAVVLLRLLRSGRTGRTFQFQHTVLRRDGKWTGTGRFVAASLVVWLAFTVHAGVVSVLRSGGEAALVASNDATTEDPDAVATRLEQTLDWFDRAHSIALYTDPRIQQRRGVLLRELARFQEPQDANRMLTSAFEALQDAVATSPGFVDAVVPLTDLYALRGDLPRAASLLRSLDERSQRHPDVAARLQRIEEFERAQGRGGN